MKLGDSSATNALVQSGRRRLCGQLALAQAEGAEAAAVLLLFVLPRRPFRLQTVVRELEGAASKGGGRVGARGHRRDGGGDGGGGCRAIQAGHRLVLVIFKISEVFSVEGKKNQRRVRIRR
jgi:hypothetical protein